MSGYNLHRWLGRYLTPWDSPSVKQQGMINTSIRDLENYSIMIKTLTPKESKVWRASLALIIFLVGLITIFPWTKTNKTKLQIESDIRGAEKKIGNRP